MTVHYHALGCAKKVGKSGSTPGHLHFKFYFNLLLCIVRCRSHPRHNTDEHSAVGPLKPHLTVCSVPRCYPDRTRIDEVKGIHGSFKIA